MTVSLQYAAEKTEWTGVEREIGFGFECIGPQAFEVWLETSIDGTTFSRVRVTPQFYQVQFGGGKPTFIGGSVILTGDIPSTTTRISIERNTRIDQKCDLQNFSPFMMPTLEYVLDKLTMIIQELISNKCGLGSTNQPLQPYVYAPYTVLSARLVNDPLDILAIKATAVFESGGDCTADPNNA